MKVQASAFWTRIGTSLALAAALTVCGGCGAGGGGADGGGGGGGGGAGAGGGGAGGGCAGAGGGDVTPPPPQATVSLYAGSLQSAGSQDGVGAVAQFNSPEDVAQDGAGNVYVADTGNHTVRRISTDGVVTTLAGAAGQPGSADGVGTAARFSGPAGVAVDAQGNVYVSDRSSGTLRRISTAGVVTTIAGAAGQTGFIDGDADTARLGGPGSIAIDAAGTIYFVDGRSVRKRAPDGTITTFAGNPNESGPAAFGDGAHTRFEGGVLSVAVDGAGNVYVAERALHFNDSRGTIRKFDAQARAMPWGAVAEGVVSIGFPSDIAADAAGNVYVVSNGTYQWHPNYSSIFRMLQRIAPDGTVTTLAGGNEIRTVDGPSASSRFTDPTSVAVGPDGRIVVAERGTNSMRLVDTARDLVSTLAGGSLGAGDVDGVVAVARFFEPKGIAATADGTLYVADKRNNSVRQISAAGVVTTLARGLRFPLEVAAPAAGGAVYVAANDSFTFGGPIYAITPEGTAPTYNLGPGSNTRTLAADNEGNVYAVEYRHENGIAYDDVIVISADGTKRILASGARVWDLAVDAAGNVYFTSPDRTVGVIDPGGNIVTRAGRANVAGTVDGIGQDARFGRPNALAVDPAGNMYVSDGPKIRKVTPHCAVTTIADITQVQGVQPGFAASSLTEVNSLAWSGGALYATVLNAVIRIGP